MKKFNSIPRIGKAQGLFGAGNLWIQEKMDGANFRFAVGEHFDIDSEFESGLIYGSRNVEFHGPDNLNSSFKDTVQMIEEFADIEYIKQYCDWNGPRIFFGESMQPHRLEYRPETPQFLGFDIYDINNECFEHPKVFEAVFDRARLPVVPQLERKIPVEEFAIEDYEFEDSKYLPEGAEGPKTEGIVIKNPVTNSRAKYRTEAFTEAHGNAKRGDVDEAGDDDSHWLAAKFTTEARVNKQIEKMKTEGYDVEMSMMDDLWERVYYDVIDEEYDTILKSNYTLNTKDFRSSVASRTASILEARLSRPNDSVLNQ